MFHELGKRNHVEWIDDNLFSKCITRDLMATTLSFMLKNMQKRMVIAPKSFYNWRSKFGLAVCPTINDPRPPQDRSFIPINITNDQPPQESASACPGNISNHDDSPENRIMIELPHSRTGEKKERPDLTALTLSMKDFILCPQRCQATGMAGGRTYAHSALSPCCR